MKVTVEEPNRGPDYRKKPYRCLPDGLWLTGHGEPHLLIMAVGGRFLCLDWKKDSYYEAGGAYTLGDIVQEVSAIQVTVK